MDGVKGGGIPFTKVSTFLSWMGWLGPELSRLFAIPPKTGKSPSSSASSSLSPSWTSFLGSDFFDATSWLIFLGLILKRSEA
jgi:hypothetical protein